MAVCWRVPENEGCQRSAVEHEGLQCPRSSELFHLEVVFVAFGAMLGENTSSKGSLSGVLRTLSWQGRLVLSLLQSEMMKLFPLGTIPKVSVTDH